MRKDDAPRTAASDWTELSGRRVVLKCSRPTGEKTASGAEQPVSRRFYSIDGTRFIRVQMRDVARRKVVWL